jgi:hypothetical protein
MKLFRNSKKNVVNDVLNIVPSDVRLVSFISMNMNFTSFIKYIDSVDLKKINKPIFVGENEKPIEKDDVLFYVLILALVHENEKMLEFLHKILLELGNKIDIDIFRNQIKDIDALITNKKIEDKKGGADLKKMLYELLMIGVLIYTAFYDYFIITSGMWQKMGESVSELTNIATQIQSGCGTYTPSEKANFLSKYGFGYYGMGNSDVVYKIDSVLQCMTQPALLTSNLEEIYKKGNDEKILGDLFVSLNNAYPTVFSDEPSLNESKQLVLAKPSYYGLVVRNPEMNTMDIQKTTKQLETITKMNQDEFKQYILSSMKTHSPLSKESEPNTYLSGVTSFMSDLYNVVANEIGPIKMTPSLSVENAVLYSIQDNIKNAWRHMEDVQTQTKRKIQDKITDTSRLITEIGSLPRTLYTLFSMNSVAFFMILYFINKMKGGKTSNKMIGDSNREIEYNNYLEGGRKTSRKNKKNTLKKINKKNKSRKNK